jgi:hypothetical protein
MTSEHPSPPTELPDGDYDAFVVDVEEIGPLRVHLTIVAGEHKGLVVTLDASEPIGSFVDLIGMPATITVADGVPSVAIDR